MAYPQQIFSNFAALLTYINNEWITNGNGDITGVIGNNVVNGLLTFITQSPLNYEKADIISSGGDVVTERPVTVIRAITPDTINWSNNIYNQVVIINTTAYNIPLADGVVYYNSALVVQSVIPAQTTIVLMKADNDWWIQTNQSGNSAVKPPIVGVVGGSNMPDNDTATWQNDRLKGLGTSNGDKIQIHIAEQIWSNYGNNASFTLDNIEGEITLLNGNKFWGGDSIYVDTNQ